MANKWFKFFGGEYLSDPKIDRLSPVERSCWITLLCLASMSDEGIVEFLTVEVLLNKAGIQLDPYHPEEWEKALGVLVKFQNLKMIELSDDGTITVTNWKKRQEVSMTGAERVANYRERRKEAKSNENVTGHVTSVTTEENRLEKNRLEKKEIGDEEKSVAVPATPSPADEMRIFVSEESKQNEIMALLVSKGLPEAMAEREVRKFLAYWTELNKTGKKQRWELQKTFELRRRLATWFNNIAERQQGSQRPKGINLND